MPAPGLLDTFRPMAGKEFRVVYYDQRGVGASPVPARVPFWYGPDAYVADLERLRVRLGVSSFDLVGDSWGGAVAAMYTAAHPDRVHDLVEVDGEPLDHAAFAQTQQSFQTRVQQLETAGVVPASSPDLKTDCQNYYRAVAPVFAPGPAAYQRYRQALVPASNAGCAADYTANDETLFEMDDQAERVDALRTALRAWTGSALVIEGAEDPFGPLMETADLAQYPAAHVTRLVVPNAGHIPFLDDPGLLGVITAYLRN